MEFISDVSIITMANVSTLVDNYLSDSTEHTPDVGVEGLVEEQASEPEPEPEQEQELDVQVPQEQEEAKEEVAKEEEAQEEAKEEVAKEEVAQEVAQEEEAKEIKKDEENESHPEEEKEKEEDSAAASASSSAWIVCFSNRTIHQTASRPRRSRQTPVCTRTTAAPPPPPRSAAAAPRTSAPPASPSTRGTFPPPRPPSATAPPRPARSGFPTLTPPHHPHGNRRGRFELQRAVDQSLLHVAAEQPIEQRVAPTLEGSPLPHFCMPPSRKSAAVVDSSRSLSSFGLVRME